MILAALLLTQAGTAIEAERDFNRTAQTQGQWTAFRRYAADNAVMFVPRPENAQKFLKDRKDPPIAVQWWPAESYVSCDGTVAVNTGPWAAPRGVQQRAAAGAGDARTGRRRKRIARRIAALELGDGAGRQPQLHRVDLDRRTVRGRRHRSRRRAAITRLVPASATSWTCYGVTFQLEGRGSRPRTA